MNHLHRRLAPIADAAWDALDAEAVHHLTNFLAARKLVDLHGPTGAPALRTGRRERVVDDGVRIDRVTTLPMYELRRSFTLKRSEIEALERGATDVDLDPLRDAARSIAAAEDDIVFNGVDDTATKGSVSRVRSTTRSRSPMTSPSTRLRWPRRWPRCARAMSAVRTASRAGRAATRG